MIIILFQRATVPPAMWLLLLLPPVLGIVTIVLVARRLGTVRSTVLLILGALLVASPFWAPLGWAVLLCIGGSSACS